MKKILTEIMKWTFLILFVASMICGFLAVRTFGRNFRGAGFQERTAAS